MANTPKTFEELFTELQLKAANGDPSTSRTAELVGNGVHAIGKKVVEEAAEVWMAAEYEGKEAAAEEISQLLYHVQVMMVARGISSTTSTRTSRPELLAPGPAPARTRTPFASTPRTKGSPMLRIAVPNKGSLSGPASAMLHEAGYRQRKESKELVTVDPDNEVEFFYLRPKDIAIYVASGKLDIGITGRDLLLDSGANAEEILPLNFGRSTFRYATKPGTAKAPRTSAA